MPSLYRVFPYLTGSAPTQPGGALYIPSQGGGRLDNPEIYSIFYAGNSPAGAVAEAFGRFLEWTPAIFAGSPTLPGSVRAIAHYRLPETAPVCDLDDPRQLLALGLRPSEVVSRDYRRTRAWARRIFEQNAWDGLAWWSYYDPGWSSFGLWQTGSLKLRSVEPLHVSHPAVLEASRTILRRVAAKP